MPAHSAFIPYVCDKGRVQVEYGRLQSDARSHAASNPRRKVAESQSARSSLQVTPPYKTCKFVLSKRKSSLIKKAKSSSVKPFAATIYETAEDSSRNDKADGSQPEALITRYCERAKSESRAWQWSKGARVDPFNCIPGGDSDGAAFYLDFFVRDVIPCIAHLHEIFNITNAYGKGLLSILAESEPLFHTIVGMMMIAHTALIQPGSSPPQAAFTHCGLAMAKLRRRLSRDAAEADDGSILTMLHLAGFEKSMGNQQSFVAHMSQVEKMISLRGGVDQLHADSTTRGTVDLLLSVLGEGSEVYGKHGHPVAFPFRSPSSWVVPQKDPKFMDDLPSGFRNVARSGTLSIETMQVIQTINLKRDQIFAGYDADNGLEKGTSRSSQPRLGRSFRFLRGQASFQPTDEPRGTTLEILLDQALFRYCVGRVLPLRGTKCFHHSVTQYMTASLPEFEAPDARTQRDCLIWIWLVAIDAWAATTNFTKLPLEGVQLLRQMRDKFPELEDWQWWDLETLGRRFFWRDNMHIFLGAHWMRPVT